MANSEVYPSSLFPLRGDLSAESGATTVEVIGLQTIPIAPNPYTDKAVPTYVLSNDDIEWIVPTGGGGSNAIYVNGNPVSQDSLILVDNKFILVGDYLGVLVNGTRIV